MRLIHTAIHLTHIVNRSKLISEELGLSNVNGYVLWYTGLLHQYFLLTVLSVNLDPVDSIITKRDATAYGLSSLEAPISGR